MSNGPTRVGGKTYKEAVDRQYINAKFLPEMWCTYSGRCKAEDLMFNEKNKVCFLCKWRQPLDIPYILDIKGGYDESY